MSDPTPAPCRDERPWPSDDGPALWHEPGQAGRWESEPATPAWAPPPPGARPVGAVRRSGRWAGIVVLVVSLVACLVAAAPRRAVPGTAATTLIGADGHHEPLRDVQIDWAWLAGGRVFADGPTMLLATVPNMDAALRASWVRETRTYADRQDFVLHDVAGGALRTHVQISDGEATLYEPALLTLPSDVHAGATWTSQGTRTRGDQALPYTATGKAGAAADGCLLIDTVIVVSGKQEATQMTWCPGRGIVGGTRLDPTDPPTPTPGTTDPEPATSDPASWEVRRPDLLRHGAGTIALQGLGAPLFDGRAMLNRTSGDLVTFESAGDGYLQRVNAHAGGEIVTVASFGDVAVVASSLRRLSAFDTAGRWLWDAPEDEVAQRLHRLGADSFVSVGADGTLRAYALADARPLWRHDVGAEVRVPPQVVPAAGGQGIVVVADRDGRVRALRERDGTQLWQVRLDDPAAALTAGRDAVHVLSEMGDLTALDPATGRAKWTRRLPMAPSSADVVRVGDRVVVRSNDLLVSLDAADGTRHWRRRVATRAAYVWGQSLLIVERDRIVALRADGTEAAAWPLDPVADSSLTCATTSRGLACLGAGANPLVLLEAP